MITPTADAQGAAELLELSEMEGDEATLLSLRSDVSKVNAILAELEFERVFSRRSVVAAKVRLGGLASMTGFYEGP